MTDSVCEPSERYNVHLIFMTSLFAGILISCYITLINNALVTECFHIPDYFLLVVFDPTLRDNKMT